MTWKNSTDKNSIRHEYLDASANVRHHGNLRFAQLTLFSALTGGLLSIMFGQKAQPALLKGVLESLGIVLSICFFVIEYRTTAYWYHYRNRAAELEKSLQYTQYSTLPFRRHLTAANAVKLFYASVILLWLTMLAVEILESAGFQLVPHPTCNATFLHAAE